MKGFHVCKPGNAPTIGHVKSLLVVGDRIKSKALDQGGQNYTIVSVTPRESYKDSYGNVGYDIEVEPANGTQSTQAAPQQSAAPRQGDDRSNRIERQSARRDAIEFHALECASGGTPSLDRVKQVMDILVQWIE